MFFSLCLVFGFDDRLTLLTVSITVNKEGDAPIHCAAESGSLSVVQYLITQAAVDKNVTGMVS